MVRYVQYLVQGKVSQGVTPTVSLAAALLIFVGVGVFAVAIAQVSSDWCICLSQCSPLIGGFIGNNAHL